jgi:hypothetical protein
VTRVLAADDAAEARELIRSPVDTITLVAEGGKLRAEVRGEPASVLRTARSIVIGASFGTSIDMRIDNLVAGTGFEPVTFRL